MYILLFVALLQVHGRKTDGCAGCELICHDIGLEMLFRVLSHYNIYDICNYTSTDLLPQLLIKSGAVKRPGVILVDSDGADYDLNNTPWCPAAAQLRSTNTQLLKAIVAPGAESVCEHAHTNTHTSTNMPSYTQLRQCFDFIVVVLI